MNKNLIGKRKYKFYLFEINRKAKKYLENILKLKNIYYNEIALCNKNGTANYNYNRFFESAGSSLSNVVKNDTRWNFSRKLIMKILLRSPKSFVKYKVHTTTLDSFLKLNFNKRSIVVILDQRTAMAVMCGVVGAITQSCSTTTRILFFL